MQFSLLKAFENEKTEQRADLWQISYFWFPNEKITEIELVGLSIFLIFSKKLRC